MLTSEGGFSRTTHIVKDKMTGRVRLLTATEAERIQGFPTDHTKYCLVKGETVEMPLRKRRFMMGKCTGGLIWWQIWRRHWIKFSKRNKRK